jgi:tetratricopeptide (TPR) repeat protein
MKHIVTALLALSIPATGLAQTSIMQSPAYKECIALSNSQPQAALAKADEWLAIDAGVSAQHCRAMALYGLRRYPEAAEVLNIVRNLITPENLALRTFITHQTASAWSNANRSDLALAALDTQLLELAPARGNNVGNARLTSDLLLARARINIPFGKTLDAIRDLDHAVSLTPVNPEVLLERAQAFELIGDRTLAKSDVEAALTVSPSNTKARALLSRLDAKTGK